MMGETVMRRECDDGGMCDSLSCGEGAQGLDRSFRGFTAVRLTLPSGTEFEQPNHWGGPSDADSQRRHRS